MPRAVWLAPDARVPDCDSSADACCTAPAVIGAAAPGAEGLIAVAPGAGDACAVAIAVFAGGGAVAPGFAVATTAAVDTGATLLGVEGIMTGLSTPIAGAGDRGGAASTAIADGDVGRDARGPARRSGVSLAALILTIPIAQEFEGPFDDTTASVRTRIGRGASEIAAPVRTSLMPPRFAKGTSQALGGPATSLATSCSAAVLAGSRLSGS